MHPVLLPLLLNHPPQWFKEAVQILREGLLHHRHPQLLVPAFINKAMQPPVVATIIIIIKDRRNKFIIIKWEEDRQFHITMGQQLCMLLALHFTQFHFNIRHDFIAPKREAFRSKSKEVAETPQYIVPNCSTTFATIAFRISS